MSESEKVVTLDHFPFLYLCRSVKRLTFDVIFFYPSTEAVTVAFPLESIIKFVATLAVYFILGTIIDVYDDVSVGIVG
ncbi:MAG: hypothetical protein ACRDA4_09065 [Filifactoraceae bacterium]